MIQIEVEIIGAESFISQDEQLIANANQQASRAENIANKVATWLFYIALNVATIALIIWWMIDDFPTAIMYMVTTLVIACPHALGLTIPLVVACATAIGAQNGILVKNREEYVIILDKTGTLTDGVFEVLAVQSYQETYTDKEIVSLLAGIEKGSTSSRSIIRYAEDLQVEPTQFEQVEIISGVGIQVKIENDHYQLVSQKHFGEAVHLDQAKGATVSVLLKNNQKIGAGGLGDHIKESSHEFIAELKNIGIKVMMATGDNQQAARLVADQLKMDYVADQTPKDKHELVIKQKQNGQSAIMVGDGVNDGPSLAAADLGIAIGAGTQVVQDSAYIILTKSDPGDIQTFLELSNVTQSKMRQNLAWGAGYNFIAI